MPSLNIESIKKIVDNLREKGFKSREIEICQHCGWVGIRAMMKIEKNSAGEKFFHYIVSCIECGKKIRAFFVLKKEKKDDERKRFGRNKERERWFV